MRFLSVCAALALIATCCFAAPLQVTGKPGHPLGSLVGSDTLVTVILKVRGAEDPNLRLHSLADSYFVVLTDTGKRVTYTYDSVASLRVQDGPVEKAEFRLDPGRALTESDQEILGRAEERLRGIFNASERNQEWKIRSATLLAVAEDPEAIAYLEQLLASNDLPTQFDATKAFYLLGREVSPKLLRDGLNSGNRRLRGQAALLAGFSGLDEFTPDLMSLVSDRAAEHAAPAAIALAHLNKREAVPQLMSLLASTNSTKNDAAMEALIILGGDDIAAQLEARANIATGQEVLRIGLILHALKKESGAKLLRQVFNSAPTLAPEAAIALTAARDYDAETYLREQVKRRINQDEPSLVQRARFVGALVSGGDNAAQAVFQQLLRLSTEERGRPAPQFQNVKTAVFEELIRINDRGMLRIIYPSLEDSDQKVTLDACNAAMALVNPDYRERYLNYPR